MILVYAWFLLVLSVYKRSLLVYIISTYIFTVSSYAWVYFYVWFLHSYSIRMFVDSLMYGISSYVVSLVYGISIYVISLVYVSICFFSLSPTCYLYGQRILCE